MNAKKIESRLAALKKKHQALANQIVAEESYPSRDTQLIKCLKRRKCLVKTRIARVEKLLADMANSSTAPDVQTEFTESPVESPVKVFSPEAELLALCPEAA